MDIQEEINLLKKEIKQIRLETPLVDRIFNENNVLGFLFIFLLIDIIWMTYSVINSSN